MIKIVGSDYTKNSNLLISSGRLTSLDSNKYLIIVQEEAKPVILTFLKGANIVLSDTFHVKIVPIPIPRLANLKDTFGTVNQIVLNPFLTIVLPGCNLKNNFSIISFRTSLIKIEGETTTLGLVAGHVLPADQIEAIKLLRPGDKIMFDDIRVIGPDDRTRKLGSLIITIK